MAEMQPVEPVIVRAPRGVNVDLKISLDLPDVGQAVAEADNFEQARFLAVFAGALRDVGDAPHDGLMQCAHIRDAIGRLNADEQANVIWMLEELR